MRPALMGALLTVAALGGLACNDAGQSSTSSTVVLERVDGLTARVPAGTTVSDNAVGIGAMLKGPGVSMTIGRALDVDAKNLDEAEKNAQAYEPKDLEGVKLSDGFILTYRAAASTGEDYWLVGRRRIGNVSYTCGVSSPKQAHQRSAIEICKSLAK